MTTIFDSMAMPKKGKFLFAYSKSKLNYSNSLIAIDST